ncbi:MAG TPA: prepilin-type cleavage/methylation domain-containing protein [Methylophilaceae bacterium]|nr:prepilin-type cleavage/methylation domain-containing protein [Methylophilaceae bacterium]
MNNSCKQPPVLVEKQEGVVILEVLIAILIFSMGILGLVGLQAAMIKNTAEANYRAEANYIAQQRLGSMWADITNMGNYLEEDTNISDLLPNGSRTVTFPAVGQVRVVVTWQQPGETNEHNVTLNARIVQNPT